MAERYKGPELNGIPLFGGGKREISAEQEDDRKFQKKLANAGGDLGDLHEHLYPRLLKLRENVGKPETFVDDLAAALHSYAIGDNETERGLAGDLRDRGERFIDVFYPDQAEAKRVKAIWRRARTLESDPPIAP